MIDRSLGFEIERVEEALHQNLSALATQRTSRMESWSHLSSQVFQTPYAEVLRILQALSPQPGDLVVDLGAAYGRMAFVLGAFYPLVRFLGYECAFERVVEARRVMIEHGLGLARIVHQDIEETGFFPEQAGHYFLYDFGTRAAIAKALSDLKRIALKGSIQVAARGRATRDAIEREHPWLSQVHPPRHFGHYSIYRS